MNEQRTNSGFAVKAFRPNFQTTDGEIKAQAIHNAHKVAEDRFLALKAQGATIEQDADGAVYIVRRTATVMVPANMTDIQMGKPAQPTQVGGEVSRERIDSRADAEGLKVGVEPWYQKHIAKPAKRPTK